MKKIKRFVLATLFVWSVCFQATTNFAFTSNKAETEHYSFLVEKIPALTAEGEIYQIPLRIENKASESVAMTLTFRSLETVRLHDGEKTVESPDSIQRTITIDANGVYESTLGVSVVGAYRQAHYPIYSRFEFEANGKTEVVDLVPVIETNLTTFLASEKSLKVLTFNGDDFLKLSETSNYLPYWRFDGGETQCSAVGWTGSTEPSKASFSLCKYSRNGVLRSSWSIHPPYAGGPGTNGVRIPVEIPSAKSVKLRFYNAMRDVFPPEPPTDGVTFRVYAREVDPGDSDSFAEILKSSPATETLVSERHIAGVAWEATEVDLSSFAGKTVLLTFENDPGPKRDTTCDGGFWGDVVLTTDPRPSRLLTDEEKSELQKANDEAFASIDDSALASPDGLILLPNNRPEAKESTRRRIDFAKDRAAKLRELSQKGKELGRLLNETTDEAEKSRIQERMNQWATEVRKAIQIDAESFTKDGFLQRTSLFKMSDGQSMAITPGANGIFDGTITIGTPERSLRIDGLKVRFNGAEIGSEPSLGSCLVGFQVAPTKEAANILIDFQKSRPQDGSNRSALSCVCYPEGGAIRFQIVSNRPERIESVAFGTTSEKASRVYYGHGYCFVRPKAFREPGDGFGCSTSHVGFDFENGLSILQATTLPIDYLDVDPERNVYSLSSHPETCLTLMASPDGAIECAKLYRPLFDKEAAPLVAKKAGRFVFDFWGGSYQGVLDRMKEFVRYGLTDSMLIQHVWQRYGYDVRLPDVWPPRPEQGTLAELQETLKFCNENDVPFGLHDNYIDFYPDAEGFSYDHILFNPDGSPQKAWYNPGPDVQSYRWNSTHFKPWLERNLRLIKQDLMLTAYFVDVFSSIHIADYYERDGSFVTKDVSRDAWNDCFDTIRKSFDDNAITVSESGSDALIGHLDGADAILRRITKKQENFTRVMECEDFEYVPWFDAVNHARFALHGVGYSDRYQGGVSRPLRGIESDDYISAEILTGHALMGDLGMSVRGMLRKYWLAQVVARSVAMGEIVGFEFVDQNIHRQKIQWNDGTTVYVNRGDEIWVVKDADGQERRLPKFGFLAFNDSVNEDRRFCCAVETIDGQVVESCRTDDSVYVNPRRTLSNEVVPIRPSLKSFETAENRLKFAIDWEAFKPTDQPYAIFVHLERPKLWWADKTELFVLGGSDPVVPTDRWDGVMSAQIGEEFELPGDLPEATYAILVGLYDPKSGKRLPLLGTATGDLRVKIGELTVKRSGDKLETAVVPNVNDDLIDWRLVPNEQEVDFGYCRTQGAFRCERREDASDGKSSVWRLTPLPGEPKFEVRFAANVFVGDSANADSQAFVLKAFDQNDVKTTETTLTADQGILSLEIDSAQARYYELSAK